MHSLFFFCLFNVYYYLNYLLFIIIIISTPISTIRGYSQVSWAIIGTLLL